MLLAVSASLGLSLYLSPFVCLPSCVLLNGGVRLSGSLALFVSLHVSFCVVVSGFLGFSLYLSPFICLPSCVLLGGGVRLSGFLALFVSLHLSPLMCPSGWWCPALRVSCFICLPSFVSLYLSPTLAGSVRLSGCLEFICLPLHEFICPRLWLVVSGSPAVPNSFVSAYSNLFVSHSGWWCPALWLCLPLYIYIHLSPALAGCVRLSACLEFIYLPLKHFICLPLWLVVSGCLAASDSFVSPYIN